MDRATVPRSRPSLRARVAHRGPILAGAVALLGAAAVIVVARRTPAEGHSLEPIGGQLTAILAAAGALAVLLLARRMDRRPTSTNLPSAPTRPVAPAARGPIDVEAILARAFPARRRTAMRTEARREGAGWVRRLDDRIPVLSMGGTPDDTPGEPSTPPGPPDDELQSLTRD